MRLGSLITATAVLLTSMTVMSPPAGAATTYSSFLYDEDSGSAGAYTSPGYTTAATEDATTHAVTLTASLSGSSPFFNGTFTPPTGQQLTAGTSYPIASTASATEVGVSFGGCARAGTLKVLDLVRDGNGALTAIGVDYDVHCTTATTTSYYSFRWNSTAPERAATSLGAKTSTWFASVDPGQSGTPLEFVVYNSGPGDANISAITLQGDNPTDFTVTADGCTGIPLAARAACTLQVAFTPTAPYRRSARLQVTDDSLRGGRSIAVEGYAYGPPGAPVVTATERSDGVQIRWQPGETGARPLDYVEVLRGDTPDTLQHLAQVSPDVMSFADRLGSDTAPTPGHTYVYGVRAHNDHGDGAVATATAQVPAVAGAVTADRVVTVDGALGAPNYPTQGHVYNAAEGATVSVLPWSPDGGVDVTASGGGAPAFWLQQSGASWGAELSATTYTEGLNVSSDPNVSECYSPAVARTTVSEIAYDSSGAISRLAADYLVRCTATGPRLTGVIRWHSDLPFTAATVATPVANFPVKVGASTPLMVTYRNRGTTTESLGALTLQPSTASGSTTGWTVTSNPCTGQTLAPGGACTAKVSVTPAAVGHKEVLVSFADDTALGAHVRKLSAWGIQPPPAPTGHASGAGANGVTISWGQTFPAYAQPTSWQLYKKVGAGSYALLKSIPVTTSARAGSYTDPDLRSGMRSYLVRGLNAAGAGALSNAIVVRYGPQSPRSVAATGLTRRVVVTWSPPLSSFTVHPLSGYTISRVSSTGTLTRLGTRLVTDARTFPVTGLAPGQKATVRVQALYASLVGPASSAASATATSASLMFLRAGPWDPPFGELMGRGVSGGRVVGLDQPRTWSYEWGVVHNSPPSFSPNRQYIACTASNGAVGYPSNLIVRRTDGAGRPRFLTSPSYRAYSPAVSPDGKWVAFTHPAADGHLHLYRIPWSGGTPTLIPNSADLDEPSWARDGKSLWATRAVAPALGMVHLTLSGSRKTVGTGHNLSPVVSPDGKTVTFLTLSSTYVYSLKVLTVSTGAIRTLVANTGGWATRASWTPNSGTIYFTVTSDATGRTTVKRISRTGSGLTALGSLGVGASFVVYEQW